MSLKNKILDDLKSAMKAGEAFRVSTLRLLVSAINNKEIEKRKKETGLGEEELVSVLQSEAKKLKDAAEEFNRASRVDLKEKEEKELEIVKAYLPQELFDSELDRIIEESLQESGAKSIKDLGQVMKVLQPKVRGRADGSLVANKVKERLS